MAMQAHLVELERKHKILENELHEALVHLSTDDLQIVELKRRKLMVKDEIERLRHTRTLKRCISYLAQAPHIALIVPYRDADLRRAVVMNHCDTIAALRWIRGECCALSNAFPCARFADIVGDRQ